MLLCRDYNTTAPTTTITSLRPRGGRRQCRKDHGESHIYYLYLLLSIFLFSSFSPYLDDDPPTPPTIILLFVLLIFGEYDGDDSYYSSIDRR